ncbi:NAD(P)-binding protein [Penicillium frequentans]|nr:NAD(P)-binding protein [Penicillium glabrum]
MAAGPEDTSDHLRNGLYEGGKNHVEIHDSLGARRELPQHYYERFRDAFVTEAHGFKVCCLGDDLVPISLQNSVKAVIIGQALQKSLICGQNIFD